jgi:hypothetical protein
VPVRIHPYYSNKKSGFSFSLIQKLKTLLLKKKKNRQVEWQGERGEEGRF